MKSKKVIIIDFDGTIVSSTRIWNNVYCAYCLQYNLMPSKYIDELFEVIPFDNWIEEIKATHKISSKSKSILRDMYNIAIKLYCEKEPNLGFKDFVNQHHQDKLIIISKEEPILIESYLKNYNIESFLSIIQDCNNCRINICFYQNIAKENNCSINDIIYIDDSLSHCNTAKKSGAYVIGVNDCHSLERQRHMRAVCDIYVNDFIKIINI